MWEGLPLKGDCGVHDRLGKAGTPGPPPRCSHGTPALGGEPGLVHPAPLSGRVLPVGVLELQFANGQWQHEVVLSVALQVGPCPAPTSPPSQHSRSQSLRGCSWGSPLAS